MKLLRYLTNGLIDLYILCFFIMVIIKLFIIGGLEKYPFEIGGCTFAVLYILGVMWRMGEAKDIMNEYIKDDVDRRLFGMNTYATRNFPIKKGAMGYIWIVLALGLTILGLFGIF